MDGYQESWLTYYSLARDGGVDAVADVNDGSSEDAGWTVFEAWGVNDTGQVTGLGPRCSSASTTNAATS